MTGLAITAVPPQRGSRASTPSGPKVGDVRAAKSADQIAADVIGKETPLRSLELGTEQNDKMVGNCESGYSCIYQNTMAWLTPMTPLPLEIHPRVVFERLFGDGTTPEEQLDRILRKRSILDSVTEEMHRLERTLGHQDRRRVTQYFAAVRGVEQRLQKTEAHNAESEFVAPDAPIDIPDDFDDHAKLMFDLQALAFQADITRVITFQLGRELSTRTYPRIGVPEQHHGVSHHQTNVEKLAQGTQINTYHAQLLGYFLEQLRSTPDGDGSLLDHTLILYGGGIGDGNLHSHDNLPCLIAGGGSGQLTGGRHLRYAAEAKTPMTNLLVTLLGKLGVPIEKLGDSTGQLDALAEV